ncbi:type I-C CRISPR-associated protein Cas5 [Sphingomonas gilva]|uniref:Type I-C CRISPR-associated protein Cas5 n=1 Tax=Sphingomonas gilva TaxID=2305907 RepID=A0A396RPU3_9SPHN|nr:type I-C CRISPR-associated protein Cas5c [Sphingomonas gilva]RHW17876.1 type I-C CRISPR-associated protein Cas5 [Sphingomonas gilva]
MAFRLLISGPKACFPRPEFRFARISYDVMTPVAAKGVLEAIHLKPSINWIVQRIRPLMPIRMTDVAAVSRREAKELGGLDHMNVDGRILVDVAYLIEARFELTALARDDETTAAHSAMFQRRCKRGGYIPPFLGMPGFSSTIRLLERDEGLPISVGIPDELDLGWMIYDVAPVEGGTPRFFRAEIKNGVLDVPPAHSPDIRA